MEIVVAGSTIRIAILSALVCLSMPGMTTRNLLAAPDGADTPLVAGEQDDSLRAGSPTSLTLVRDQTTIQCIELARDAVQRKDFLAALPLIERSLAQTNSFVPINGSQEVASHEEAHRLIQQFPTDMRQRWDESRRSAALLDWETVRFGDLDVVERFGNQFGDLSIGVDTFWHLANSYRDRLQNETAYATFLRVANHRYSTQQQRAIALLAAFDEQSTSGHRERGAEAWRRLRSLDPDLSIKLRGDATTLREWITRHQSDMPTSTQAPPSAEQERLLRPLLEPTWTQPLSLPLDELVASREIKQREQGVRPIPLMRPLVTNGVAIVRSLDEIVAVDIESGERKWSVPNSEFVRIPDRFFENSNVQAGVVDWIQLRFCADSLFGRMSADKTQLFVLQSAQGGDDAKTGNWDSVKGATRHGMSRNSVCGYSIATGDLNWEIGGASDSAHDPYSGLVFLGCPLAIDSLLYVIAQRETDLELLAIESKNGQLSWTLKFGAALLPLAEDLQRSRVACPILWHDGLLICSTSAGAVVAVDPILKTIKWAYRYPATTFAASDLVQGPNPHLTPRASEPWWDKWREPFLATCQLPSAASPTGTDRNEATSNRVCIFASPESDQIHAFQTLDGKPLWRTDRNAALFIAGIVDDRVIVVEGDFVRAHDVATGRMLWRSTIDEPAGPGVFAGATLILTSDQGVMILVDTRTGQVNSGSNPASRLRGSLVQANDDYILTTRQKVARLPRLDTVQRQVDAKLRDVPGDEATLVRAAELDLEAGNPESALHRLAAISSDTSLDVKRRALLDALRSPDSSRPGTTRSELIRELKELAADPEQKFLAAATIASSALSVPDPVGAVEAALEGLETEGIHSEALVKTASVLVRRDRYLLGIIEEAVRRASPAELTSINELFAAKVNATRKSRDRFAMHGLIEQLKGLDWSRKLLVQEDDRSLRKRSPSELELHLLDAAGSDDADIAYAALNRLKQRFDKSETSRRESFAMAWRMAHEFPEKGLAKPLLERPKSMWPAVIPKVDPPRPDRTFEIFTIVPMEAQSGSLAERLDVWLDRNGNELLFRSDSFFPTSTSDGREQTFKLQTTSSPYRGPTGYMLRRAWGVGRAIILLIGTELFAVSPFDDRGYPNTEFLWSNPIDLQSIPGDTRIVPSEKGNKDSRSIVVDQSNRAIGKIGPVRAGYLCFQKGTKLVAVETDSGKTVWERLDFPADSTVIGDDHQVFLWNDRQEIEVLSAVDGRQLEVRRAKLPPSAMFHQHGALVWTLTRDTSVQIELHNFRSGEVVWSRTEPPNTQVTALDPETFGIARPGGEFHIIAARTGQPIGAPLAVKVDSPSAIVSWNDAERWYVAVSSTDEDRNSLKGLQIHDSYRLKFITGTLFAIDSQEPQILWQRGLLDEPLSLDQPRTSPVLVQLWKLPPKGSELMLRLIDKRTGTVVFERSKEDYSPYYLLNPDPQQGILELKLARETIQINYPTE